MLTISRPCTFDKHHLAVAFSLIPMEAIKVFPFFPFVGCVKRRPAVIYHVLLFIWGCTFLTVKPGKNHMIYYYNWCCSGAYFHFNMTINEENLLRIEGVSHLCFLWKRSSTSAKGNDHSSKLRAAQWKEVSTVICFFRSACHSMML